ncbi:thiol-disulfide oxidoreductase DCC family protein [Acaryochloris marina]|uniref:Thiol-disulfide oxidoreductase n=1 Tax=Acaryochloris marina (strain MBIC 11017) TaxID=329726 RepID=B0CFR6_ACAM1|nr:DUF393 domain-containing protein [Acaryochloris marina]ABW28220.1 conserved hypothetical protein [Acaryochloris marina MBIC11017]BDM77257.1 hypothetical protein AM10699_01310 [Acaryochloris marina MBIC10699]
MTTETTSSPSTTAAAVSDLNPSWQIKLLYDSACPLCLREVNFLQNRDAGQGLVAFVDIADLNYAPEENGNIDFETAMGTIHALLPDGTVMVGVPVFRKVYEVLGMGWVYAITKLPIIGPIADFIYDIWANWRLKLTGRADLATILAERQRQIDCSTDRCKIPVE